VSKELRELWSAARAQGGDEPVDSLAILDVITNERRFVAYRRLLESSSRESFSAMLRETVPLRASHVQRESWAELTPHIAATLEIAIEIAHRRGTPATSADVLDGLAIVPGSLAFTVLARLGYVPCGAARQAWRRLEQGEKLFWQQRHERALDRFEAGSSRLAAELQASHEGAVLGSPASQTMQ
jgi:hypothetical protein